MGRHARRPPTQAEYDGWREKFSNRGRFGTDDELGTLNHITPEVRRSAAGLADDIGPFIHGFAHAHLDASFGADPASERFTTSAGVHASALEFLWDTKAAILISDMLDAPTADQGLRNPIEIEPAVHLHCIAIPHMGMPLLDNAQLDPRAGRQGPLRHTHGRLGSLSARRPPVVRPILRLAPPGPRFPDPIEPPLSALSDAWLGSPTEPGIPCSSGSFPLFCRRTERPLARLSAGPCEIR